jgi:CRISPR-associated protein Csb1
MNYEKLEKENRLLIEARLRPLQGTRFQPTGFPNLGAADYVTHDGTQMLLVESSQSMANRMEKICWDESKNELVPALQGIPYVRVRNKEGVLMTTSIEEAHRLNSPYILEGKNKEFFEHLKTELDASEKGKPDYKQLAKVLLRYDLNSLIHGIFLAKKELANGRLRVARSLSSFVEARNVTVASSGGVKKDDLDVKGDASKGFGHVPFAREEYTGDITAFFNLDLAEIRGYGLGRDVEELLITISLYKIQKLLAEGLRFRTACDLELIDIVAKRPSNFELPTIKDLEATLPSLISKVKDRFADPPITEFTYEE